MGEVLAVYGGRTV